MLRHAKNRAATATTMKIGRYGSSRVRFPIQAPLTPTVTRSRGPRQQTDAKVAAIPPANSAVRVPRAPPTGEAGVRHVVESVWQQEPPDALCSLSARRIMSWEGIPLLVGPSR